MKLNTEIFLFLNLTFKTFLFSVLLISIFLYNVSTREMYKYTDSKHLLDFKYYHTTKVKLKKIFYFEN